QARKNLSAADEVKRIDAEGPPKKTQKNHGADPNPAGTSHGKALRSIPSPIFYPVAARELIKTHIRSPLPTARISVVPANSSEPVLHQPMPQQSRPTRNR